MSGLKTFTRIKHSKSEYAVVPDEIDRYEVLQ